MSTSLIIVVVVVDPRTLAKCQWSPLPTRRYNHGEVASTIIEPHCNSIYSCSVRCRCGLLSYLYLDLQKRSSHPGWFTDSVVGAGYLLGKKEAGEKCLHLHPHRMTIRPRVGEDFRILQFFINIVSLNIWWLQFLISIVSFNRYS